MQVKDGGPAFPICVPKEFQFANDGMSLRDWFAGQALAGIHAARATTNNAEGWEWAAQAAYAQADAMLTARSQEKE